MRRSATGSSPAIPGALAVDAGAQYANEISSSLYQSYNALLRTACSNTARAESTAIWPWSAKAGPRSASRHRPCIRRKRVLLQSFANRVQLAAVPIGDPETISCANCSSDLLAELKDQYNQDYAQYVRMLNAYATDIVSLNTSALLGRTTGTQTKGPALLSYSDYINYIAKMRSTTTTANNVINPLTSHYGALFTPPTATTTSGTYYNITSGIGAVTFTNTVSKKAYTTTASDYATLWTAYFFNVANANTWNTSGTSAGTLPSVVTSKLGSGKTPTLDNVGGNLRRYSAFMVPSR